MAAIGSPIRAAIPSRRGFSGATRSFDAGLSDILSALNMVVKKLDEDILPEVLVDALTPTLEKARDVYCPMQTGELRRSGYVEARKGNAEIGFGRGGLAPYAIFVHENPNFFHKPPTQAKFLQRAMDEDIGSILGRVVKGISARMRT